MDQSKHTVTIPIEDYNKLVAAAQYEGLIEVKPGDPFYNMLKKAIEADYRQVYYKEPQGDVMAAFTFYAKKL